VKDPLVGVRPVSLLVAIALSITIRGAAPGQASAVAPVDLSKHSPSEFRDDELDLPYYVANFHRLANSIALSGPRRGFIDIAVWRTPKDNEPYNARIMENILSLAFFYATNRPWNPYRGDPAVRARLEAALEFWTTSQSNDGRFSEYAPRQWSLAPTAFATKFMGEALRMIADGPAIDSSIHRRAIEADRRAIVAVLTRQDLYEHGRKFSNQFDNVWGGALAYLSLYPDAAIARLVRERLKQTAADHQSPVGYFYEADGADWGYDLNTHHSDLHAAWQYARATDLASVFLDATRRWYEWLGYNAVPEPSGNALTLAHGFETRQKRAVVADVGAEESEAGFPIAEHVPAAWILGPTREDVATLAMARRAALARQWPHVDSLAIGSFRAFSPYAFLHRSQVHWNPTDAQRASAIASMRHQREQRFTHQRVDSRQPLTFTYVRRPAYYAAFASGPRLTAQQRYGLELLWIPGVGSVLQSQSDGATTAWGTRGDSLVAEASGIAPTMRVGGFPVSLRPGSRDLPSGDVTVEYAVGVDSRKTVTFSDRGLRVVVRRRGAFVEQLPLLALPTDSVASGPGSITLARGNARVTIRWSPSSVARVERTNARSGEHAVVAVGIPGSDSLRYDITTSRPNGQ
jgi:hypothetical protein